MAASCMCIYIMHQTVHVDHCVMSGLVSPEVMTLRGGGGHDMLSFLLLPLNTVKCLVMDPISHL